MADEQDFLRRFSKFCRDQNDIHDMAILALRNQFLSLMMDEFGELDFFTDKRLPDGFLSNTIEYKSSLKLSMN